MRPSPDAPAEPSPALRRIRLWLTLAGNALLALGSPANDAALLAHTRATLAALAARGAPSSHAESAHPSLAHLQRALAPHILFEVHINPEMRVKVSRGPAKPALTTGQWHYFLAHVTNESGTTAPLQAESPQHLGQPGAARDAWLELQIIDDPTVPARLSGQPVEYRLLALRPSALGRREARFSWHVGQGTQDLGFRSDVDILFHCSPPQP